MTEQLARKHYERGRQYELQDQLEEAMNAYEQACNLSPSFPEPYEAMGRLLALRGLFSEAIGHLDNALERGDDVQTRQWRGYVLGRLHRYGDALDDYLSLRHLCDSQIEVNIGRMLLALRRFDEAEDVLAEVMDPSAEQLLNAIPRYREFDIISEDVRSIRYLFGGTCVLGTLGEESLRITDEKYQLLDYRHIAFTLRRFLSMCERQKWQFDVVVGAGARHRPLAQAVAKIMNLPWLERPTEGHDRYLLCSSVVNGMADAAAITKPVRAMGAAYLHLALGLVPKGDPNPSEPHIIGFVNRCAVPWYRVEPYSRLKPADEDALPSMPQMVVGPAYINPNGTEVVSAIVNAVNEARLDPGWPKIAEWYEQHRRIRCRQWDFGVGDLA